MSDYSAGRISLASLGAILIYIGHADAELQLSVELERLMGALPLADLEALHKADYRPLITIIQNAAEDELNRRDDA